MFLSLLLAAAPVSIAVPGVSCVGMQQKLCESFLDRFVSTATNEAGDQVKIVSQRDIAVVIGVERQKQLLGCADSSRCIAELAGALGSEGIVSMSITRSEPFYVVTLRLTRSRDASAWFTSSERVDLEGEVFDAMDVLAKRMIRSISVAKPSSGRTFVPFLPGIAGLIAGGCGIGVFLSAAAEAAQLSSHQVPLSMVEATVESGRFKQQVGVGLLIGGGVLLAASVVWALLSGPSDPKPLVAPVPGGAALMFGGAW